MYDCSLELLQEGLVKLNLNLSPDQEHKLLDYLNLLQKWNKAYNLTSIVDEEEMIIKHLLDSLAMSPYMTVGSILDVGTGAGLPSIPLSIIHPEIAFIALDSQQKKINFVLQAILLLKIKNLSPICKRIENFDKKDMDNETQFLGFDIIISRAFSSLAEFVNLSKKLLKPTGLLYAMKGKISEEELASVPRDCTIESIYDLFVPGLNASRSLIVISKNVEQSLKVTNINST